MFSAFFKTKITISTLESDSDHSGPLKDIASIHKASFEKAWDVGEIASTLKTQGMQCLLASDGKAIVGFLIYRLAGDEGEVITIASAPKKRRAGIARALMEQMIRNCLIERAASIFLEVDENNIGAVGLYRKLAFTKVGERKGYYNPPKQNIDEVKKQASNALIMKLNLKS